MEEIELKPITGGHNLRQQVLVAGIAAGHTAHATLVSMDIGAVPDKAIILVHYDMADVLERIVIERGMRDNVTLIVTDSNFLNAAATGELARALEGPSRPMRAEDLQIPIHAYEKHFDELKAIMLTDYTPRHRREQKKQNYYRSNYHSRNFKKK